MTSEPIQRLRRRGRLTSIVGGVAVLLCAAWALRPLPPNGGIVAVELRYPEPAAVDDTGPAPLDLAAFDARTWITPPPDEPPRAGTRPPPPPPPPPPVRLQLIAVASDPAVDGAVLRAVLYDPDSDRLIFAAEGDRVGRLTVQSVTGRGVELADERSSTTLTLHEVAAGRGIGP